MTQPLLWCEIRLPKKEEGHVGWMQHWNFVFTNSEILQKHICFGKLCTRNVNTAFNEL